ncbi:hypothetical protein AAHA92_24735 [Salvia divinorum]|uniref:Uncharacterized protein n=1 Tax=Salvia divinorum TaxID=28513 RepID=A0ABD1G8B7_SALDI
MNNSKGNERVNDEGVVERKVETVDCRKPAGEEEPHPEKVAVTHLVHDDNSGSGGAAAKVAEKLSAVGDTISRMQ